MNRTSASRLDDYHLNQRNTIRQWVVEKNSKNAKENKRDQQTSFTDNQTCFCFAYSTIFGTDSFDNSSTINNLQRREGGES